MLQCIAVQCSAVQCSRERKELYCVCCVSVCQLSHACKIHLFTYEGKFLLLLLLLLFLLFLFNIFLPLLSFVKPITSILAHPVLEAVSYTYGKKVSSILPTLPLSVRPTKSNF